MLNLPGHDPIDDDDLAFTLTPGNRRRGVDHAADLPAEVRRPCYDPPSSGLLGPTERVDGRDERIFEIRRPGRHDRLPLLVHIPHAGTLIPDDVREAFVASREVVAWDLARSTDHAVDELWEDAVDHGATILINRVNRLVCDVERFPDDALERPMSDLGRGVVYLKTGDGLPLRAADTPVADIDGLVERFWSPWQELVAAEVERMLSDFGVCYLIDAHSFPERPLGCEADQDVANRPDICLGWEDDHCPYQWQGPLARLFEYGGFSVGINRPFRGSFVPARYHQTEPRVLSIMVEVNRRLYLDEGEVAFAPDKAPRVQRCLAALLDVVGGTWPED